MDFGSRSVSSGSMEQTQDAMLWRLPRRSRTIKLLVSIQRPVSQIMRFSFPGGYHALRKCFKRFGRARSECGLSRVALGSPSRMTMMLSSSISAPSDSANFGNLPTICVRFEDGRLLSVVKNSALPNNTPSC